MRNALGGDDRVLGARGNDEIDGGSDDDTLFGDRVDLDVLRFDNDPETLGDDVIPGGDGADMLVMRREVIDGARQVGNGVNLILDDGFVLQLRDMLLADLTLDNFTMDRGLI